MNKKPAKFNIKKKKPVKDSGIRSDIARYWYAVITNSKLTKVGFGKSSSRSQRTPVTLASPWGLATASLV